MLGEFCLILHLYIKFTLLFLVLTNHWFPGEGLGGSRKGIADPIMAGNVKKNNLGVGAQEPGEVSAEDDIYEQYKKRMMLGYRYRPNPLVKNGYNVFFFLSLNHVGVSMTFMVFCFDNPWFHAFIFCFCRTIPARLITELDSGSCLQVFSGKKWTFHNVGWTGVLIVGFLLCAAVLVVFWN